MSERVEGTIEFDGSIEGRLSASSARERLREWVDVVARQGLRFSLDTDGDRFSLLVDDTPVRADRFGTDPVARIGEMLDEMLALFADEEHPGLGSTLRSRLYRKGVEEQTLYDIGPGGLVDARSRTVDAETTPPPQEITKEEKIRLGLIGLCVALLLLAVASFFVNFHTVAEQVRDEVVPIDPNEVKVEAAVYERFFAAGPLEKDPLAPELLLTLTRTTRYPKSDLDYTREIETAPPVEAVSRRLAVEALARGYVRCEFFNARNECIATTFVRVRDLEAKPTLRLRLPVPRSDRLVRIVLTY